VSLRNAFGEKGSGIVVARNFVETGPSWQKNLADLGASPNGDGLKLLPRICPHCGINCELPTSST